MTISKTHSEKTAAETKSIGFDYQYYFFLWKVLALETGASVGLEVKDDVHTELDNNEQVYFQIKHSLQKKADGSAINLKTSDVDLWKTLSNWAQVISDESDQRGLDQEQIEFLKKTSFVLASNKSGQGNNQILESIAKLQKGSTTFDEIKETIELFSGKTKDENLKKYVCNILKLSDEVLHNYLLKVFFELDEKDIVAKCKDAIRSDKIEEKKIDGVFASIDSAIRKDNFITIKSGGKIQISFDEFKLKYRRHYDLARNGVLIIEEFKGALPNELKSQVFIRQLIEIEDFQDDDIEEIARLTSFKLKLQNNIDTWFQAGEITDDEITRFKQEAINQWKNKHKKAFRSSPNESDHNARALDILDSLKENTLTIAEQPLDTDLSNGTFYDLSDEPLIGWRKDWEKYKK